MSLKQTPLNEEHRSRNAKMVDFGGWDMPVQYEGISQEHNHVRKNVGAFDVSHMGEIFLHGPDAVKAADRLCSNNIAECPVGKSLYSVMMNENGDIIDDVIAYRISEEKILLCVNASNIEKDARWVRGLVSSEFPNTVEVIEDSVNWGQIAVQGPQAIKLLTQIFGNIVQDIRPFHFKQIAARDGKESIIIARTGYTGEDGCELFIPAADTKEVWRSLLGAGATPCGLGARDTLRLEAGLCLYGNDIDDEVNPLEAGLSWVVKLDKPTPAIGFEALRRVKEQGVKIKLSGLVLEEKRIARHGYAVYSESGDVVGEVTSGTLSPLDQKAIAMAYLQTPVAGVGSRVFVDLRGTKVAAHVVKLPFYRRPVVE